MQFDLFDQKEARGAGERQCELEEMIAYEETMDNIQVMSRIVENQQAEKIDGVLVDMFTANAVVQIYDAVNDNNKAKMRDMGPVQLANIAYKIMEKA